ncbi:transcriptional regulator [bacterium]|nr:transcriptional regulator [bacterium]
MKPIDLINSINPLLHDRVRLGIMVTLVSADKPVEFNILLDALDLTKGNLSSHSQKLEEAKLIKVTKEFVDRKPRTSYACTDLGRKEIKNYLKQIEHMLTKASEEV